MKERIEFEIDESVLKNIEEDFNDRYSKYSEEKKIDCMGGDVGYLLKCVEFLKKEIANRIN